MSSGIGPEKLKSSGLQRYVVDDYGRIVNYDGVIQRNVICIEDEDLARVCAE